MKFMNSAIETECSCLNHEKIKSQESDIILFLISKRILLLPLAEPRFIISKTSTEKVKQINI